MAFFADIAPEHEQALGGKARSLLRLQAAGLRTPSGFVITDELFRHLLPAPLRAWLEQPPRGKLDSATLAQLDRLAAALQRASSPTGFDAELEARLTALGASWFSVRSSFAAEDDPDALSAGVYHSCVPVARAAVGAAVRTVLRSAFSPGALAYAQAAGRPAGAPPLAVLVHVHVPGDATGAAAFAPDRDTIPTLDVSSGELSAKAAERVCGAARTLAAQHGPVEVEWTARGDDVTFLQLRPYRAPARTADWPGWRDLPADERPDQQRWDAAHNPVPLSPAQAGLVALVDERCRIGIRQRVLGGYLFWAPDPRPAPAAAGDPRAALDRLTAAFAAEPPAVDLEESLALFLRYYEPLLGAVQPAARTARERLRRFLQTHAPGALNRLPALLGQVPSLATRRRSLALALAQGDQGAREAYLASFGDESPAWDVAAPTYGEAPERLATIVRPSPPATDHDEPADQIRAGLPPEQRPSFDELLARAREAVAVGEDDDVFYARVQAVVRRALLALGGRLAAAGILATPEDLFWLPLSVSRRLAAGETIPTAELRTQIARAREDDRQARATPPPAGTQGPLLRGHGTGGRAVGRVHHHGSSALTSDDAVLVARTLLPTELPLLEAVAFVTETGGPLGHVAAQARERGLPAVVGAAGATALPEGTLVLVDADAGMVVPIESGSDRPDGAA